LLTKDPSISLFCWNGARNLDLDEELEEPEEPDADDGVADTDGASRLADPDAELGGCRVQEPDSDAAWREPSSDAARRAPDSDDCSEPDSDADSEPDSDARHRRARREPDAARGERDAAVSRREPADDATHRENDADADADAARSELGGVEVARSELGGVEVARSELGGVEVDFAADGAADAANQFEDELEDEEAAAERPGTSLPTYITDFPGNLGKRTYIAKLVREMGLALVRRKTTQRTGAGGGRVANAPLAGSLTSHEGDSDGPPPSDGPQPPPNDGNVHVGDHAAALLLVAKRPTLVVVEICSLVSPNGTKANHTGLSASELADFRTETVVRPLKSSHLGNALLFSGESSGSLLKVGGCSLQPITLRAESTADGQINLAADVDTLADVATVLWLRTAGESASAEALAKAPHAVAHRDASTHILFAIEGSVVDAAPAGSRRSCPLCSKTLPTPGVALSHASYHIIHTSEAMRHSEACPLCFGPAANCTPFLLKTSTLQPRIACQTFAPSASAEHADRGVKFQAQSLSKSTTSNPSTNRPIVCPACHPDLAEAHHLSPAVQATKRKLARKSTTRPAVWSYNMRAHWSRVHNSSTMPAGLAADIRLAIDESKLLKDHFGPP
jgi:hypothetical protein